MADRRNTDNRYSRNRQGNTENVRNSGRRDGRSSYSGDASYYEDDYDYEGDFGGNSRNDQPPKYSHESFDNLYEQDSYGGDGSGSYSDYSDGYGDDTADENASYDFDQDYERLRVQNDRLRDRRADQRAQEAAKRRLARREQEIRRAKIRLGITMGIVAAAVLLIFAGVKAFSGIRAGLLDSAGTEAQAAENSTEAASEASTAEADEAEEADANALPSEEQVAADRAAKHYSAAVATFWPYYTFHTTANTKEIPSIPSDQQGYEKMITDQKAAAVSADSSSGDVSASDGQAAGSTVSGVGNSDENDTAEVNSADAAEGEGISSENSGDENAAEDGTARAEGETAAEENAAGTDTIENTLEAEAAPEPATVTAADGSDVPAQYQVGGDYVASYYGIVVNADNGEILAEKRMNERIVPASMTKVMTLLTAVETLGLTEDSPELKDMVTLTTEDEEYAYVNGSSAVCWMPGDTASVEDLMYGTILPSGADAAVALSEYVSGSQDEFVKLMNQKAEELGIGETTHFTNCVGVYDEDHYSTVYDIAVIMKAALENDLCRKILSEHVWTTSPTSVHPEGITVSNWFLRRIEDRETNGLVLCAKTGFVNQSGFCAVSYQECDDGSHLIVCTAHSSGNWRCINDHVALYREYSRAVNTDETSADSSSAGN